MKLTLVHVPRLPTLETLPEPLFPLTGSIYHSPWIRYLLPAGHAGERLHTGLDGRVRSLRVRVVLAHEGLHLNHQRLDVRTDGFLICLKGLDCDIPLVFAQNIIFIRVWES